jgi:asparaginyl-tRNA synthetase
MLGPYTTKENKAISYRGNKQFPAIDNINGIRPNPTEFVERATSLNSNQMWGKIARINHRVNLASNNYFDELRALFVPLPLTTRMISSPGAVYGKEAISYTTDTSPIKLKWFDLPEEAFLSESSQIYLELSLIQSDVTQVYSIYSSFRKEIADATHLSEFHHIEYEGNVSQEKNETIALGLISRIIKDLLNYNEEDLSYFLSTERLGGLEKMAERILEIPHIKFSEALEILHQDTRNERYKNFTMEDNFGAWEEIRLTEIFGTMVAVRQFPLLEVPFYHAIVDNSNPKVADCTDFIWPGYRETIGSGHRIKLKEELEEKARIFDLPKDDYLPYLQSRTLNGYKESSGFGLGWERMLQGILEMPFIWSAVQFPRVDLTLKP